MSETLEQRAMRMAADFMRIALDYRDGTATERIASRPMAEQREQEPVARIKGWGELLYVIDTLLNESEEFDFDDGIGRGAQQQYWDDVERVVECFRQMFPPAHTKQTWAEAIDECVGDPKERERILAKYPSNND